ncbi:MAG: hypothetical protein WC279_07710 [Sulfurimonas sp.]|jgi:hypothetical protein|uniref:hypothetical protein n=1 Tax=Sulfurimonas sp. TaxID=2022749 RepID=UPI00356980C7
MLKINYSKSFDKNAYYKYISTKKIDIDICKKKNSKCIEKDGKKVYEKRIQLKNIKFGKNQKTVSIEKLFELYKTNKIGDFDIIFQNISFKCLTIGNFRTLQKIKNQIGKKDNKYIKFIFNYTDLQTNKIKPFFEENFQTRTCYFCNIHFVNEYKIDEKNYQNEFTLDHFYDKATYPYLGLSLYNLIPSCYTCNSKLKKNEEFKNLAPSSQKYDFETKVKFKLFLDDSCKNLHIKSKDDIDIALKENYSNQYDKYIEVFKLNERYKVHKDIVFKMIQNAELYPESRLRELQDLTGLPFQQIKKDIFNLIDENEDLSKQPFSKLIKDISEELKLI